MGDLHYCVLLLLLLSMDCKLLFVHLIIIDNYLSIHLYIANITTHLYSVHLSHYERHRWTYPTQVNVRVDLFDDAHHARSRIRSIRPTCPLIKIPDFRPLSYFLGSWDSFLFFAFCFFLLLTHLLQPSHEIFNMIIPMI